MARLMVFLSFLIGLALILTLNGFKKLPISNRPFNVVKVEKEYKEKMALLKAAEEAKAHGDGHGEDEVAKAEAEAKAPAEVVIVLDTEELKNGHQVYNSKGKCITCHGKSGEGKKSQKAPRLAGQHDWYLFEQLVRMKSKVRDNKVMEPYIKNLSEKDLQDVSAFLSKFPVK